jgi:hypothetical protein
MGYLNTFSVFKFTESGHHGQCRGNPASGSDLLLHSRILILAAGLATVLAATPSPTPQRDHPPPPPPATPSTAAGRGAGATFDYELSSES